MEKNRQKKQKQISVYVVTSLNGVEGVYYKKTKADNEAKVIDLDLQFAGNLLSRVQVKKFKVK